MLAAPRLGLTPIVVGTHALLQPRCRLSRPRPRRHRRAAPLRRRAAPGARREGPRRRHPGDDRDADPAHPDDDRLWRSRCLAPRPKSRRAGRPIDTRTVPLERLERGGRGGRPRAGQRRQGLLDLPAGRGIRGRRPRRRARSAIARLQAAGAGPRRAGARPDEERRARTGHGRVRRRGGSTCWWRRR